MEHWLEMGLEHRLSLTILFKRDKTLLKITFNSLISGVLDLVNK